MVETIQNMCSFNHSWQRGGDPLPKTRRQESSWQVVLCCTRTGALLPRVRSSAWLHLGPADTTQMPRFSLLEICSQLAVSPWRAGLWEESSLHLASAWEQLQFETYKYFFTPSSFQLMCRWKPHRWSVGENPCLAKDGLLLL